MTKVWMAPTVAAFSMLFATSCGGDPYLKSVTEYAGTVNDGARTLEVVPDTLGSVCHKRAIARYTKGRILGTHQKTWTAYFAAEKEADGVLSWNEYCADIEATGDNFAKLIKLLGLYASAMKSLASQGEWDGESLSELTTNLSSLAGSKTPTGKALTGLASHAQDLGKFVMSKYTAGKARDFAAKADGPIQTIVKGLSTYIDSAAKDVVAPSATERTEVIDLLETKAGVWIPADNSDASRIITFVAFARETAADTTELRQTLEASKSLIEALGAGQHKLANATDNKVGAVEILAATASILVAINSVREASAPVPQEK